MADREQAKRERDEARDLAASRLDGLSSAATRYESAMRERDRAEARLAKVAALVEALRKVNLAYRNGVPLHATDELFASLASASRVLAAFEEPDVPS